ncbi:Transcription factor DIVARICATA [Apostasia shenzhenica]|uniref:Transcription factor DIVARICATA n=1 Tax=Apostasia shenzhenica TaxID=1088818 RepID=A0A2I0B1L0_9ASPA|nr:Transcription factor DIVARICATA [Apostasia shenzhenica]
MDFMEEEARPRFLFQARSSSSSSPPPQTEPVKVSKLHVFCCLSSAAALLAAVFCFSSFSSIVFTLLLWTASSLLLAPFAPAAATGGDLSVGRGDPLPPPVAPSAEPDEPRRRSAFRWSPKPPLPPPSSLAAALVSELPRSMEDRRAGDLAVGTSGSAQELDEEWTDSDFQILKRQISKYPAGAPGRWERVAEAFKGRHSVECVIRTAKSLSVSERSPPGGDSFAQFLKQRKPIDKRVDAVNGDSSWEEGNGVDSKVGNRGWSSGEDFALLKALKAFPKDVPMRWERMAEAVPGKSKADCMKRVAELKRDFRSSKASKS